jgi:hypothetical protein
MALFLYKSQIALAFLFGVVLCRVLFLASEYVFKQVRVVPSINTPTTVNPSIFCSLKKEPSSHVSACRNYLFLKIKMNFAPYETLGLES